MVRSSNSNKSSNNKDNSENQNTNDEGDDKENYGSTLQPITINQQHPNT